LRLRNMSILPGENTFIRAELIISLFVAGDGGEFAAGSSATGCRYSTDNKFL
jgi:hypothetical protein